MIMNSCSTHYRGICPSVGDTRSVGRLRNQRPLRCTSETGSDVDVDTAGIVRQAVHSISIGGPVSFKETAGAPAVASSTTDVEQVYYQEKGDARSNLAENLSTMRGPGQLLRYFRSQTGSLDVDMVIMHMQTAVEMFLSHKADKGQGSDREMRRRNWLQSVKGFQPKTEIASGFPKFGTEGHKDWKSREELIKENEQHFDDLRQEVEVFVRVAVVENPDCVTCQQMYKIHKFASRLAVSPAALSAITQSMVDTRGYEQIHPRVLEAAVTLAIPSLVDSPALGEAIAKQAFLNLQRDPHSLAQNLVGALNLYLGMLYSKVLGCNSAGQYIYQTIASAVPFLRYCPPSSSTAIVNCLVDLAGIRLLQAQAQHQGDDGSRVRTQQRIEALVELLTTWPESTLNDIIHLVATLRGSMAPNEIANTLFVAAALKVALPGSTQSYSLLLRRMYPIVQGAEVVWDQVLVVLVPAVTELARGHQEWRECAVQLRDRVTALQLGVPSQGAFLEAYGIFLRKPELYGSALKQLAQVEQAVMVMHTHRLLLVDAARVMEAAEKKKRRPLKPVDPLVSVFDDHYRQDLHETLLSSLPLHSALLLEHRHVYTPSVEYGMVVHDLLLEGLPTMRPADVALSYQLVAWVMDGAGVSFDTTSMTALVQERLLEADAELPIPLREVILQLLARGDPSIELNGALLNALLRPVLENMRDEYTHRPAEAAMKVLAGRAFRVLVSVVAMRRQPVAQFLRMDLLKLVQATWAHLPRAQLARAQKAVKGNMDYFLMSPDQWGELVSGKWVGLLATTHDVMTPLSDEAAALAPKPKPAKRWVPRKRRDQEVEKDGQIDIGSVFKHAPQPEAQQAAEQSVEPEDEELEQMDINVDMDYSAGYLDVLDGMPVALASLGQDTSKAYADTSTGPAKPEFDSKLQLRAKGTFASSMMLPEDRESELRWRTNTEVWRQQVGDKGQQPAAAGKVVRGEDGLLYAQRDSNDSEDGTVKGMAEMSKGGQSSLEGLGDGQVPVDTSRLRIGGQRNSLVDGEEGFSGVLSGTAQPEDGHKFGLEGMDEGAFMSLLEEAAEAGMRPDEVKAYLQAAQQGEETPALLAFQDMAEGASELDNLPEGGLDSSFIEDSEVIEPGVARQGALEVWDESVMQGDERPTMAERTLVQGLSVAKSRRRLSKKSRVRSVKSNVQ